MKYIFIISICFLGLTSTSQVQKQPRSNFPTVVDSSLAIGKNFILPVFRSFSQLATYNVLDSSGRLVFIRDSNAVFFRDNAHTWVKLAYFDAGSDAWQLTGNTISSGQFLGTINNLALALKAYNKNVASFNGNTMIVSLGDIDSLNNGTSLIINDQQGNDGLTKGRYEFNRRNFKIGQIDYIFPPAQGAPGSYLYNPGNGFLTWNIPGSSGTFPGIDSFTISPPPPSLTTSVGYWIDGAPIFYPLAGDSSKVINDTLFQYFGGDSIPYPVYGNQIFFGDTATISGDIFCSIKNGNDSCILINNNGRFVDSIGLNSDSTEYLYFNNDVQLGSFPTLQKILAPEPGQRATLRASNDSVYVGWDSTGFSSGTSLFQPVLEASVFNENVIGTVPSSNGAFAVTNEDDANGIWVFNGLAPPGKISLLGIYDTSAQTVFSGVYHEGGKTYVIGESEFSSNKDSVNIILNMPFSNSELPTDSLLSIDVNGQVKKRAIPGGGSGITRGTTAITSGTSTRVLYDSAGIVGEYGISGTGSVAMTASPTFTGLITSPALTLTSTTTGFLPNRVTTTQMNAIGSPSDGMMVYNTDEGSMFTYNTDWGWESNSLKYNTVFGTQYFNDLLGIIPAVTAATQDGNIVISTSGGAVTTFTTPTANRQGIIELSTSTSATARSYIATSRDATAQSMVLGGGRILYETSVQVPTLSTSGERFAFVSGFTATMNNITIQNGAAFLYDEGGVAPGSAASANWQVLTASGGSRTYTTTSTTVTAGQWYKLQVIVNAAATSVGFYIDGTLVHTETSTIPSVAIGFANQIVKSNGTTARSVLVDYVYLKQKYTTAK